MKNLFLSIFILFSFPSFANEELYKKKLSKYFKNIDEFSSAFIQIQNNDISEGFLYIKNKRLRIDYVSPRNLIFVLKKNKGMFYNPNLEEVQYFNTKNSSGEIFFDLFHNDKFILNASITKEKAGFYVKKTILIDDMSYAITILFEASPLELRKIELNNNNEKTSFAIINPNYNPELDSKMFSLANPLLK